MKGVILLCAVLLSYNVAHGKSPKSWWETMSLYQIYPRSFKDSDGDGVGDLKGITSNLQHLKDSNVDAFWLSPIYPSPGVDFGYDISDFRGINESFGTIEDFERLIKAAHDLGIKVILDFVPNHSSDKHEWFQKSLQGIPPYKDYYVWHEGNVLPNGTRTPPNNWVSVFRGLAWTYREERQAYYLHQFAPEQPDLNYENEQVIEEMNDVLRFWLDKGVDGFRVDAIPFLYEDQRFLDEPLTGNPDPEDPGYTHKIYTQHQHRTYEAVKRWREVLDAYGPEEKVLMMEAYANMTATMKYYKYGAHFPFNFGLIKNVHKDSTAIDYLRLVNNWMLSMWLTVADGTANWVAGNHDNSRLVTRHGADRAQAITIMAMLLPGVSVTYYGEEIGMEDTWISWEDTKDPQGCNAGKDGYEKASRDPARTPFQWDNATSAGFSTNPKTWLPVNENYLTLNLAAQKTQDRSYYALYKALSELRKSPVIRDGGLQHNVLNDEVFVFSRTFYPNEGEAVFVAINFAKTEKTIDLTWFTRQVKEQLTVYYASTNAAHLIGTTVADFTAVKIPASAAVIYKAVA